MEIDVVRYAIDQNRRPFTPPFRQVGSNGSKGSTERGKHVQETDSRAGKGKATMRIMDDSVEE